MLLEFRRRVFGTDVGCWPEILSPFVCVCVCLSLIGILSVWSSSQVYHFWFVRSHQGWVPVPTSTVPQVSFPFVCSTCSSCRILHPSPSLSGQFETGVRQTGIWKVRDAASLHHGRSWLLGHQSLTCVRSLTSSSVVPQYYEMSYGLNIEMHKQVTAPVGQSPSAAQFCRSECCFSSPQAEIVKRLNGICTQVLPYLSQEVTTLLRPACFSLWLLWGVCVTTCRRRSSISSRSWVPSREPSKWRHLRWTPSYGWAHSRYWHLLAY